MEEAALEQLIKQILLEELSTEENLIEKDLFDSVRSGIFLTVDEAVVAAKVAQDKFEDLNLVDRQKAINAIREVLLPQIEELARRSVEETGLGNITDKIIKNMGAIEGTPGIEDLSTAVKTGDYGMTLLEISPYGVIGAITPSTNPTETIICNTIGMVAAGNAIYFAPHPGAKDVSLWLIEQLNKTIEEAIGIKNLIVTVKEPSITNAQLMMNHPDIAMLVVTGGPGVVAEAMKSGKKVLAAGAGNPPVIVDETAIIEKAAKDIVDGASFDHGIICVAEKSVVAVDSIADRLIFHMEQNNALLLKDPADIDKLKAITIIDGNINKKFVGKSASSILKAAKIECCFEPCLIIFEASKKDPFVVLEQLMPVLPIIRVKDFDEALPTAIEIEEGLLHTTIMHSQHIFRLNKVGRKLKTSIFVKNGPSYAGLGFEAEGAVTFTIATPTGEGTTTAKNFARVRRCVLTDGFSIR